MDHFYAKSDNFGIFNPLNPPYQGDFKSRCANSNFLKSLAQRVRDVKSLLFSVLSCRRLGTFCLNRGLSRMTRMTRILRVFRSLTRYLKRGILFILLFNLLLMGSRNAQAIRRNALSKTPLHSITRMKSVSACLK